MRAKVLSVICLLYTSVYAAGGEDMLLVGGEGVLLPERMDTMLLQGGTDVLLPEVEVSISRQATVIGHEAMQVSVADKTLLDQAQVMTPKDMSGIVPNVYMPDYGSAMTSSIYIRGMGSRINEPVMGMVVDGVPLLDKNMYDQSLQDVKRIELLRGPQGSMYGRNASAGVMEIRTIQPLDMTTYSVRGKVSYGSANTVRAQASYYGIAESGKTKVESGKAKVGWGVAARYARTDGFYTNEWSDRKIDYGQQAGGRIVFDSKPTEAWRVTGTVYADWVRQGAFPYAQVSTGRIAYNSEGSYERLALMPTLCAEYRHVGYRLLIAGSYQMMRDEMRMDNDYTTADIFTLEQYQRQHAGTIDAMLQGPPPCSWYEWTVGVSGFMKHNRMRAPVVFMREGIEELILSNANNGIRKVFPDDSIVIRNERLSIPSRFTLLNAGAAVYHQSHFHWGNWHVYAGLRADYERVQMAYLSTADVTYRFTMLMRDFHEVHTHIEGAQSAGYIQFLPRLAVTYDDSWGTVYVSGSKGYKACGYNPQIFSTITQNCVMNDMASDMGMHLTISDPLFSDVAITTYKPETNWTYEVGGHFRPAAGLTIDVDAFHIRCQNQQVTVFPNGKTSGRMMANAARSRIWGCEAALRYHWSAGEWSGTADASYGFTDARFITFDDGMGNYDGRFIPYAPQHTVHGIVSAGYRVGHKALQRICLTIKGDGIGRIYWNEQNDCWQPFYGLLGATLRLEWRYATLELWGKNITGTPYDVFYFRSMGQDFVQRGKPRELGVKLIIDN